MWVTAVVTGTIIRFTAKPQDDPAASHFSLVSVFDGSDFRPTTRDLADSKALTMFGGTKIDLRRSAAIGLSPIRLDLITVMGGTDVIVPDTWRVQVEGLAVAGGHDVRVADPDTLDDDATHLVIRARTLMGGLRIQARPILATA